MAGVSIEHVGKSFGPTSVLNDVSLTIAPGEFLSLVGPSGCGKSTLLRIIAGLERQDSGHIRIGDELVDTVGPSERNLAMVFQSYALYPHLSVAENIAVPLRMRRLSRWQRLPLAGRAAPGTRKILLDIHSEVGQTAKLLGIDHLLARKPAQLSGGQRQRVALGRALVRHPRAFLLDEPLSNLDAKLRVQMRAEIVQLHRRLGTTFIYVTHDQAEAMTMSDRIAVVMDGSILQVDTPDTIYRRPCDVRVAEFIGSPKINLLPGSFGANRGLSVLGAATGIVATGIAGAVTVGVRPEALRPSRSGSLKGRLVHTENLGAEIFLHVGVKDIHHPVIARIEAKPGADWGARIGADIELDFDPSQLVLFDQTGRAIAARHTPEQNAPRFAEAVNG